MNSILLQRTIEVRCWNVIGTIARASQRPELLPVLLRARERDRTSAEDVAEHLFFEPRSRRIVAQRLLHIAARYGLLAESDRSFALTPAGLAALDSGQVFVPEHGSWTIWASNDPLLGYPVLRVDPWREPTAMDDLRGADGKRAIREFVQIPRTLRESIGTAATPPGGGGPPLRIDELDDQGEEVDPGAALQLVWNVSEGKLRLEGTLRDARLDAVVNAPQLASDAVWRALLESAGLWSFWDPDRGLLVSFDEAEEREREPLRRDLEIRTPAIADLGQFDSLTIHDVPLYPRTESDATRWAAWRLQARLRDYATAERFAQWTKEATAPLAGYRPLLPTRTGLAREAWAGRGERPSPVTWHLVAADDWSL